MALSPDVLARHHFISYVKLVRPDLALPKHWLYIGRILEDLERGGAFIILEVPIRHGKTEEAHRLFPSWYLGRGPTRQILTATHKDKLALDCGRDIRNYVDSAEHQLTFPGVTLAPDSKAKGEFHICKVGEKRQGVLKTVGRRGDASGSGGDLVIVDDLLGETEAHSEAAIEEAKIMLRALVRRMEPGASMLIIQSRVAIDDPAGYAEEAFPLLPWRRVRFPALAEQNEDFTMPDGSIWHRAAGDALWEDRWSRAYLEAQRAQLPAHEWASSYQQRPQPIGSKLVHEEWFADRRYNDEPEDILKSSLRTMVSVDTSKGTATGARTGIGVWAELTRGAHRVGGDAERWQVPTIIERLKVICDRVKPHGVLIEDKSTGEAIIQILRADPTWKWPIIAIIPPAGMDKIVRFAACTPSMKQGYVWFPRKAHPSCAHWQPRYEDEIFRYPNCPEKDQGDETSQYLNWRRENPLPPPVTKNLGALVDEYSERFNQELEVF